MQVIINGETKTLDERTTVSEMIRKLGFDAAAGAVAVNMTFVPSDKYDETVLHDGDSVEVLAPVCGG